VANPDLQAGAGLGHDHRSDRQGVRGDEYSTPGGRTLVADPAKMTGSAADPERYKRHLMTGQAKKLVENRFEDPKDPLKLVIVRDMWLTGFDVP
jgi:hypothetical protein